MSLGRAASITGYAELPSMKDAGGQTPLSLVARLARLAAADAGLAREDIDGLLVATSFVGYSCFWPSSVAEHLNLDLRYFNTVDLGGASPAAMVLRAAAAINAGLCERVLCVVADVAPRAPTIYRTIEPARDAEFEQPYGASPPNAGYAMIARRHMHEFGTKPEQLAKIAVDQRANALANPHALFNRAPLTIEEVLSSKLIFDPLHLLEIVSYCSGGGAVVVSRKGAAHRGSHAPVDIIGAGEAGSHISITARRDITTSWAKDSAAKAFGMAGVTPDQMSFAQIYDCYTIAVLTFIEDLGFCAKGHGGPGRAVRLSPCL
jgi:acetyl-CoA acetyltransferase